MIDIIEKITIYEGKTINLNEFESIFIFQKYNGRFYKSWKFLQVFIYLFFFF